MKKMLIKIAGVVTVLAVASLALGKYTKIKASEMDHSTGSSEMYYDMKSHEYYFYQLTSEADQKNYRKIQEAIENRESTVRLSKIGTFDKAKTLVWFVLNDHPEIFWFDNSKPTIFVTGDAVLNLTYIMNTDEEITQAQEEIDNFMMDLRISSIKRSMTDYEKEVAIYDYISQHAKFDEFHELQEKDYSQSIYSVVQGKTVCRGYSLMFKYICNKYNIPCIVVTGASGSEVEANNKNINHGWNEVMIDGDWYIVDLTDSRRSVYKGQVFDTTFYKFNMTTELLKNFASINNNAVVPDCTSTKYDYYKINNTYFEEPDMEKLNQMIKEKSKSKDSRTHYLAVRCANEEVFNKLINEIREKGGFKTEAIYDNSNLNIIKVWW